MKTFVASFKLHKEFLFKRETDGCFGWEKDKKKKNAMTTQWQLFPSEGTRTEGFLLCPRKNFSTQLEQKASPDEEDEVVWKQGPVPLLGGDSYRVERTVPTVELWEGLFENRRKPWLIALVWGESRVKSCRWRAIKQTKGWWIWKTSLLLPHWWIPAERAPRPAPARSHLRRHTDATQAN